MHHIRPIRKLSNKRVAVGFNRLLRAMNRKQVPICSDCHWKIHREEYDGLKLSNLAYLPRSTKTVVTLGEPDARKRASLGSAARGWCSWAVRTRPLTRLFSGKCAQSSTENERGQPVRRRLSANFFAMNVRPHFQNPATFRTIKYFFMYKR
jgi:hypothetical protein